ncbi:MAG: ArsR family transcriptional regulator [Dehalococcoidales bacterium]|nr:ArsR family transcriptional regulator [Dehalococcoidales bacterium]
MGNVMNYCELSDGLFSKTRQSVLALLYGQTDRSFYTKQVLDAVKIGRGTVQRELQNLTESGIIIREVRGNQVHYRANSKSPIFNELKSIVRKTFGVADVIREGLAPFSDKIKVAFIFGSIARSTDDRKSDIDIMMIGDITFDDAVSSIMKAQEVLRMEINPVVYSVDEFRKRMMGKHDFVVDVIQGEKIFLIGDKDELRRLAE